MLCDSNRRLSNTRITARCQIIYFPLVFPAPEVLKHNSQNDLPIPSSISCPKSEVTTTSCRVQGPTLTRPGFCICLTSFPAFDATLFLPHWRPWLSLNWNAWFWSCLSAHAPVVFFAWAAFPELLHLQIFAQLTFSRGVFVLCSPLQDTPNPLLLSKFYFVLVFITFEHILQCTVLLCWFLSVFFPSQNNEF